MAALWSNDKFLSPHLLNLWFSTLGLGPAQWATKWIFFPSFLVKYWIMLSPRPLKIKTVIFSTRYSHLNETQGTSCFKVVTPRFNSFIACLKSGSLLHHHLPTVKNPLLPALSIMSLPSQHGLLLFPEKKTKKDQKAKITAPPSPLQTVSLACSRSPCTLPLKPLPWLWSSCGCSWF